MKSKNLKPFYNNRNIEKKVRKGEKLWVDEMFYSIQTEGPFAGRPAYFIRLWGCSLNCDFCDTPQGNKPTTMKVKDIVSRVKEESISPLVVITGGEPFVYNVSPLVVALRKADYVVQFETSGSLPAKDIEFGEGVYVVVSPKTKHIDDQIALNAFAFKFVVSNKNISHKDGLPKGVYRPLKEPGTVMISPMFTDNKKETDENIELAVNLSKQFGYWCTFQIHKLIGIE